MDLTATVFTGTQVKAYCQKLLADGPGFLDAAARATTGNSARPLTDYFGLAPNAWNEVQEQTMYVLCRSFRRFAEAMPDQAKALVTEIMENCDKSKGEGNYVHW